jgi:hypothetical protein
MHSFLDKQESSPMKLNRKGILIVATAACFATSVNTQTSQAGQWLDSVLGRRPPAYPVGSPVPVSGQVSAYSPGAYPSLGYVPPSYANLNNTQTLGYGSYMSPPANNAPLLPPGFPQTVAAQLPTAAYDTQWARTPVTYYRPVTAFDPRYGTTVTSLQPCTSYQYQAQRQPVVAPRPILGEYGFQANRWPSITGPGYNPTGLAAAPAYPSYQSIPNGGMPAIGQPNYGQPNYGQPVYGQPVYGQPSTLAPNGGAGISSGMPTSTLPLSTMQYNPANVGPYTSQQAYYAGQNYASQPLVNPAYATNYSGAPTVGWPSQAVGSGTIGSGVVPTAAWLPTASACPNGMCPQTTSSMNTPNIPGAASVVPYGPPTYSSVPNAAGTLANTMNNAGAAMNGAGAGMGYNPAASASMAPAFGGPNYSNPYSVLPNTNMTPYAAPPVLPNTQVMPSNSGVGSDPEAERRPELGRKMSFDASKLPGENSQIVQTIPMVAIDREPSLDRSGPSRDAIVQGNTPPKNEASSMAPSVFESAPQIPQTLTPRGNYGMKPLSAPEELDSSPRWTPSLLDPDDRVAMERSADTSRPQKAERIRVREDEEGAISAVALEPSKGNRNSIQLVSGVETKKAQAVEQGVIRFRPVTKLK